MVADKIKTMQLYENNTKEMFDYFMNLREILPEDTRSDFNIYYRNRVSRTTMYHSDVISSDRRLLIYNSFLNYAIDHDLFKFAIVENGVTIHKELTDRSHSVYTMPALESIYRYYSQ